MVGKYEICIYNKYGSSSSYCNCTLLTQSPQLSPSNSHSKVYESKSPTSILSCGSSEAGDNYENPRVSFNFTRESVDGITTQNLVGRTSKNYNMLSNNGVKATIG